MESILMDGFKAPIAIVDWVAFAVDLHRKSNGGHIKRAYEQLGVSHADPLDKGAGSAASKFEIRMQHPKCYAVIEGLISDLNAKYGLASTPMLRGLEVSIDFSHQSANVAALRSMTERLMVSVAPAVVHNPRIIGDRLEFKRGLFLSRSAIDATKTLYIGNKTDDVMWRIYWKRTDETFVGEDGKRVPKPLPPSEFRARVEARLQGKALEELNLVLVRDLHAFSFEHLHSVGLFKFAKRDLTSGPIFTNPYSIRSGKSFGVDDDSPACVLNRFGRRDSRGRIRQLSRHLKTDTDLTEATRLALRRLTKRF